MERARSAALAALILVLVLGSGVLASSVSLPDPGSPRIAEAIVTWPASSLVISELQTGGASASDEFVEIANQGPVAVDLDGLELVYVSSTGSTVTRKWSWISPTVLEPGHRTLIANVLGAHAGLADATYSGGFSATGGAVALRIVGGAPIDAVAWGDATNGFVEGAPAVAPPAGSSIERLPGGLDGNGVDTNDNASDFFVAAPSPQGSTAPPVPAPAATATPSPDATAMPTATPPPSAVPTPTMSPAPSPTPGLTPAPTPQSSPSPTPEPTPSQGPSPTPAPSATPTAIPTPSPTPEPPPSPTPVPSPTLAPTPTPAPVPTPSVVAIADARALPDGSTATIVGVLTTALGALEGGRSTFIEDATGGIAMYLDIVPAERWPAGTMVQATGTLDDRYAQRTLRVMVDALVRRDTAPLPSPVSTVVSDLGEALEGRRVRIAGVSVGSPSAYADGTGLLIDDGSGEARVIVVPDALGDRLVPAGTYVEATGPLGQRDASGTGAAGYRIYVAQPGDLVQASPTPAPTSTTSPTPAPTPSAAPTPTPSAAPSPTPSPSPSPTPKVVSIATARALVVGTLVTVTGIVTGEAGRLGSPALIAIGDEAGSGIVVRVPEGAAAPGRDARVVVTGRTADPYGQLEIRPAAGGLLIVGAGAGAPPIPVDADELGERTEGQLVVIEGRVATTPVRSTSNDLTIQFDDTAGTRFRVLVDASAGLDRTAFVVGDRYRLTGIAGQRATRKGALDGYRIWLRDADDMVRLEPTPGENAESGPGDPATGSATSIALALRLGEGVVRIEGVVTIPATLLDATGRRTIVQDGSGAIEVLLPPSTVPPRVGSRVSITGELGTAYGAARLRAETLTGLGIGSLPSPTSLSAAPGIAHEWRLVVVSGTVVDVVRLGERWRAELLVGKARIAIVGQAGSGIPSTALVEGRRATVVGIVRRPYPTATDRRFAILPRSSADLRLGPPEPGDGGGTGRGSAGASGSADGRGIDASRGGLVSAGRTLSPDPPDVDLGELDRYEGEIVRIGGLIVRMMGAFIDIDDGSAVATIQLSGDAAIVADQLENGDPINAIGRVVRFDGGSLGVKVDDAGALFRIGALGQPVGVRVGRDEPADPLADRAAAPAITDPDADGHRDAGLSLAPDAATGAAGLGVVAVLSLIAAAVRHVVARRRLTVRVAARVARFAGLGAEPDPARDARPGRMTRP